MSLPRVLFAVAAAALLSLAATAATPPAAAAPKPRLVLLVAPFDTPHRDLIAIGLASLCRRAGVEFDLYYAADHREGGLFSPHGSSVIGGHHAARIGRALAGFQTTVVRVGSPAIFDSLLRRGAHRLIEAPASLADLQAQVARELGLAPPREIVGYATGGAAVAPFYPECVERGALALPLDAPPAEIERAKRHGATKLWTVAPPEADLAAWRAAGFTIETAADLGVSDPELAAAERWIGRATAVDPLEPLVASYLLPLSVRERRLILTYKKSGLEAERRRDQVLRLSAGKDQPVAYGRWFGDPQLVLLAARPMAYNVAEPMRHILTVFARHPVALPQPARSWIDLEPSDEQLRTWAAEKKILATWVLHSGELSHDDSVLNFYDWSAMTKMKIGSGVHWQRYHFDPDAAEPMHVPVAEGGVLGLVEPVLHSAGFGIMWESAGDPALVAGLMRAARAKIAEVAGERFAPRGVYCFGDHHGWAKDSAEPAAVQIALWQAVKAAGFEYLITSVLPGDSRVLYRDGDFVVLNQAAEWHNASPFLRGDARTFAAVEKKLVEAGSPGWLVGAVDTPIHGSPIYIGRPYGAPKKPHPRINEFYDYVQQGGATGKVVTATPRTIARYARILSSP